MIRVAKETFSRIGNSGTIIAGTVGAQSTRENIILCKDAAEVGADFALILPPSYFPAMMTPDAIQSFYEEVSERKWHMA
jgi:dihydrodipicolinate synthase/N-acetylneuraminate lyase